MRRSESSEQPEGPLTRDQLRRVFSPILDGRVSDEIMKEMGKKTFLTKWRYILTGSRELTKKLSPQEYDDMKVKATALVYDELWNRLDAQRQWEFRVQLSIYFLRLSLHSFKIKK